MNRIYFQQMKTFTCRTLNHIFQQFFQNIDQTQMSNFLKTNCFSSNNLFLKSTFLSDTFNLPFVIDSNQISSFEFNLSTTPILDIKGITIIAQYTDLIQFNSNSFDIPKLSILLPTIISEKVIKNSLLTFLFRTQSFSLMIHDFSLHFEIMHCSKSTNTNSQNNINETHSSFGSFGFIFDKIHFTSQNQLLIHNLSIYILPESNHVRAENYQDFKQAAIDSFFILRNFNYEGSFTDFNVDNLDLNFTFDQIQFLKLFHRKLYYKDCGCPLFHCNDTAMEWWKFTYRCHLKDKKLFDIDSSLNFLKNRKQSQVDHDRKKLLMLNEYKKALYCITNKSALSFESIDYTNEDKVAFSQFLKSEISPFEFNFSVKKLNVNLKNASVNPISIDNLVIQKKNDQLFVKLDNLVISNDLLDVLFEFLKIPFSFSKKKSINSSLIKIKSQPSDKTPIGDLNIVNFQLENDHFSISEINNDLNTMKIEQIEGVHQVFGENTDRNTTKTFKITSNTVRITSEILKSIIFYKKSTDNLYYSFSYNLNLFLSFFNQNIDYIIIIEKVCVDNFVNFKYQALNSTKSIVFGFLNVSVENIIEPFNLTINCLNEYKGKQIFCDLSRLNISLYPSELELFSKLLFALKPFLIRAFKTLPSIDNFVFSSHGMRIFLNLDKYPIIDFMMNECTFTSIFGTTNFTIERNRIRFFDRKLEKWCNLVHPYSINAIFQTRSIDLDLDLHFNITNSFLKDITTFFHSTIERPKKQLYKLLNSSCDKIEIQNSQSNDPIAVVELNQAIQVDLPNEFKVNSDKIINLNSYTYPIFITNDIILSACSSTLTFTSPFILENRTHLNNIMVYQIDKYHHITFAGSLPNKKSKLGLNNLSILLTGKTDDPTEIFNSLNGQINLTNIVHQTFKQKPQILTFTYNFIQETILLVSEYNYEKGCLIVKLLNPFIFVNRVSEAKTVSALLTSKPTDDKPLQFKLNEMQPFQKSPIPIHLIQSVHELYSNEDNPPKKNQKKKSVINTSIDIKVILNNYLNQSIESLETTIEISKEERLVNIQFQTPQLKFSLALKVLFLPKTHNWKLILYQPAVIINKTDLKLSVNQNDQFFQFNSNRSNIIFGSSTFFTNSKSMMVNIGYDRSFQFSKNPIELCLKPYESPIFLPSLLYKDYFLPLSYKSTFLTQNNIKINSTFSEESDQSCSESTDDKNEIWIDETLILIHYYKVIVNNTNFDFSLTPINDNQKCDKHLRVEYKKNTKTPLLLTNSSFLFKFKYNETTLPICLLNNDYKTCFRIETSKFILLTIKNEIVSFEMSDFSEENGFMTVTNLIPNETVFVHSNPKQPPISLPSLSTSLFGFDSPFESTELCVFALNDQVTFNVFRFNEPVTSPTNSFIVETISQEDSSHSIIIKPTEFNERKTINNSIVELDPNELDCVRQSLILCQLENGIHHSFDINDYDSLFEYQFKINLSNIEISFVDNQLIELCMMHFSNLIFNLNFNQNAYSMTCDVKSMSVFDMNSKSSLPNVLSSNPENGNFLSIKLVYFDKTSIDHFAISLAPIIVSPDSNFLNDFYDFFDKIRFPFELRPLTQTKIFNLIEINPIAFLVNLKPKTTRNLHSPLLFTFSENVTEAISVNGFSIANASISMNCILNLYKQILRSKIFYSKLFFKPELSLFPPNQVVFNSDLNVNLPASINIQPIIDKSNIENQTKIFEALRNTESMFKMASDKMRLISDDQFDRNDSLLPNRSNDKNKSKDKNAAQTVVNGFSSAAKSLGSGFSGIIRKPIEGGKKDGVKGAFKGIGQGLLGVLTCTASSVIEVGGGFAGGIRKAIMKDNSNAYDQCRKPLTFLMRSIGESLEITETAQQQLKEDENLVVFVNAVNVKYKIAFIGITNNFVFLFNTQLEILFKFDIDQITWFKTKNETICNNDHSNDDIDIGKIIVMDILNLNGKVDKYELELLSSEIANEVVQFMEPKIRVIELLREKI